MNDSIGLYLNDIGKVSLLNAEEERELSRVIEKGRAAAERLENGEKGAVLKADVAKGWTNPEYATSYLERFLSKTVRAGAAALARLLYAKLALFCSTQLRTCSCANYSMKI